MSTEDRSGFERPHSLDELVDRLGRLGPMLRQQELAEAELDSTFVQSLRERLVGPTKTADFAREGYRPRTSEPNLKIRTYPLERAERPTPALAVVALLALFVMSSLLFAGGKSATQRAIPLPSRADLLFNLPTSWTVSAHNSPLQSLIHPKAALPFLGHLTFHAPAFPDKSEAVQIYRLVSSPIRDSARKRLGIPSPFQTVKGRNGVWLLARHGGSDKTPLHSLAVSSQNGEVIYHDERNHRLPRARRPVPVVAAVRVAREWLENLGWPGKDMPLREIKAVPGKHLVRQLTFGWQAVRTALPAAVVWVAPDRSIIEAWLWPPIKSQKHVFSRGPAAGWMEVTSHKVPVAVRGITSSPSSSGSATVGRPAIVEILVSGPHRSAYLVPAYRFDGSATIKGKGRRAWSALAPAMR